jgi:putative ABC transport system permease protein
MRIAWYHFAATFRQRLSSYLTLILLIGLIGGLSMAAIANARRTQSSYPTFLASTNPSDLTFSIFGATTSGRTIKGEILKLPGVRHVSTVDDPPLVPLAPNGAAEVNTLGFVVTLGSSDGEFLSQDRLAIASGHAANPRRADQIVMTASAARIDKLHVGEHFPLGLYGPKQQSNPALGTPKVKPLLLIHATLVGIGELNTQVVQDGVDQVYGFVFVTPALIKEATHVLKTGNTVSYGIQLTPAPHDIANTESELVRFVPRGYESAFHVTTQIESQVELAIKPESIALGAFGLIAALAALVLALQAISRLLRDGDEDRRVMRSLGASPAAMVIDALLGVIAAVVLGALVAVGVATALSPLGPIGPVRSVYPSPGFAFDGTVLGLGMAVLVGGLGVAALGLALRAAPGRRRLGQEGVRRSSVVRVAQTSGLSVAGVIGTHFALESGRGRTSVPVRSVLVGTVLAVAMVVATLTFSSGLSTLVSRPALYGWNWSYALNPTNVVPPLGLSLLNRDSDVAAWTGYDYFDADLDGETFPFLMSRPNPRVAPPILSGHGLEANDQIVLGAATMAALHKKLGGTVVFSYNTRADAPYYVPPTRLTIVGVATLPAVGYSSFVSQHTSMGTGAIVATGVQPAAMIKALQYPDPNLNGPDLVFVRLKAHVSATAGRDSLQRIAVASDKVFDHDQRAAGNGVSVLGVVRPVQIIDYRDVGDTPVLLAAGLALGAIVALGLTLNASVRRRRRDLALLKTFGFTQRQLVAAIAWQATVDAVVGIAFGVPIGIIGGRELWTLFARNINAVPDPTVPVIAVVLVGIGTLLFTNLVAVLPGRSAARTSTALVLRAE